MKHTDKWYQRRLAKYFEENYGLYEDTAEYFVDPDVNQWAFYISELGVKVRLTCNDDGKVLEEKYSVVQR